MKKIFLLAFIIPVFLITGCDDLTGKQYNVQILGYPQFGDKVRINYTFINNSVRAISNYTVSFFIIWNEDNQFNYASDNGTKIPAVSNRTSYVDYYANGKTVSAVLVDSYTAIYE